MNDNKPTPDVFAALGGVGVLLMVTAWLLLALLLWMLAHALYSQISMIMAGVDVSAPAYLDQVRLHLMATVGLMGLALGPFLLKSIDLLCRSAPGWLQAVWTTKK